MMKSEPDALLVLRNMHPSFHSDGLMAMAVSSQQSRDAALLRATTELFVLDRSHDRDEVRRFEELATHFLGKVTAADRAFIAERLARHPDAPLSILRMLGKDILEVASPILRHAASLTAFDLIAIMAASGPAHYRLIARRSDLPTEVIAALRMTDDVDTLALLPAMDVACAPKQETVEVALKSEPATRLTAAPVPATLSQAAPLPTAALPPVAAAKALTATLSADFAALLGDLAGQHRAAATADVPEAGSMASRADGRKDEAATPKPVDTAPFAAMHIADAPVAATSAVAEPLADVPQRKIAVSLPGARSFLMLGRDERIAILERHSSPVVAPARGASPLELDRAFQAAVSRAKVPALARQKQRSALIQTIAAGLELDAGIVAALMDDPSGEALVVLLKAIGLTDSEAQQVLLLANPAIGEAVGSFFRLVQLFGRLDRSAAESLVLHWRRTASDQPSSGYVPHYAATEPVRGARPAAKITLEPVADVPERAVFGRRGT